MDLRRSLARFIDEAASGRVVVIGNSMGGLIASVHAAVEPERVAGVVLSASVFPWTRGGLPHPAVLAAFSARVRDLLLRLGDPATRDYLAKLVLAFVITGVGGLTAKKLGFMLPKEVSPIAWATLIGGLVILVIEWALRGKRLSSEVTWMMAAVVGLAQLLAAVFPGTSRSAATIMIAMVLGLSRPAATEFSFLLAVPTLLAAGGFETLHALRHPGPVPTDWGLLALGTIVSAITAFLVVRWLIRWVQTHSFTPFGWYRIALGLAMLMRFV